jgi:phage protein U
MFAQLGTILFEGLRGFESMEHKDSTTYAQHDLINGKPVLVPAGNELEEISITMRLRAEFVKPEAAILQFKKSKDEFEVLPLLKGSGRYIGDFIIEEFSVKDLVNLADGTTVEAIIDITLKEYASADKLQQQQSAAKKAAFATGDKDPLSLAAKQPFTTSQLASQDLVAAESGSFVVDRQVSQYPNNPSQQQNISGHIQKALGKMDTRLSAFNDKITTLQGLQNAANIITAINSVRSQIQNFTFPITSLTDLKNNNTALQQGVRGLSREATTLTDLIITRRA